jgi:hypothetical protein
VTHRRNNLPDVYYPNVPPGFHRVTIEATGTKNPRSRGYQVWVDAVEDDPPWTPYMNEILQVKLDGTEVRRLAHHRSRPFDTYNYTPKASVSRDGRALLFSSNYGALKDAYTGNADTYLMEIPQ